jgi:hypothetical protein
MVSFTLIFEAFKHVAKSPFLIMERLLGDYIFCLISPWWLAWYPSKLVTLEKRGYTGGFPSRVIVPLPLTLTNLHAYSLQLSHLLGFWAH